MCSNADKSFDSWTDYHNWPPLYFSCSRPSGRTVFLLRSGHDLCKYGTLNLMIKPFLMLTQIAETSIVKETLLQHFHAAAKLPRCVSGTLSKFIFHSLHNLPPILIPASGQHHKKPGRIILRNHIAPAQRRKKHVFQPIHFRPQRLCFCLLRRMQRKHTSSTGLPALFSRRISSS